MITDAVAFVIFGLVRGIVSLLPSSPSAPDFAGMVATAFAPGTGGWGLVGQWVPTDEIAAGLEAVVVFAVAVTLFRMLAWVLALVHIAGTDS